MTSTTFFFVFIPLLAVILLAVNLIFAPHNPYQEKDSVFECGFHSFLGQNRTQFSISFFIFALLFLLFDLEILLVYPYVVSAYANSIYGLVIMLIFFLVLTLGFAFELGKNALKIDSRQMVVLFNNKTSLVSSTSDIKSYLNRIKEFFTIKNIIKIITIFSVGLFSRYFINDIWNIDVFKDYLTPTSLIFYGVFTTFFVSYDIFTSPIQIATLKKIIDLLKLLWKGSDTDKITMGGNQNSIKPHVKASDINKYRAYLSSSGAKNPGDFANNLNPTSSSPSPNIPTQPQGSGSINPSITEGGQQENTLSLSPEHLARIRTRQNMANELQRLLNQQIETLAFNQRISISDIDTTKMSLSDLKSGLREGLFKIKNPDLKSHQDLSFLEANLIKYYKEFPKHFYSYGFRNNNPSGANVNYLIERLNKNKKS